MAPTVGWSRANVGVRVFPIRSPSRELSSVEASESIPASTSSVVAVIAIPGLIRLRATSITADSITTPLTPGPHAVSCWARAVPLLSAPLVLTPTVFPLRSWSPVAIPPPFSTLSGLPSPVSSTRWGCAVDGDVLASLSSVAIGRGACTEPLQR